VKNQTLVIVGSYSLIIAVLHVAIIFAGADWYRFFGAGEELATMAENGSIYPVLLTAGVATVFAVCSAYAFCAAEMIRRLPFCRVVLILICTVYLLRGLAGIPLVLLIDHAYLNELQASMQFMLISSLVSLVVGLLYGVGTWRVWHRLTKQSSC